MARTWTQSPLSLTKDVSKAYNVLDDRSPVEIHTVQAREGNFGGSSRGMFGCVEDLLRAYSNVMAAINSGRGKDSSGRNPKNPIKQAAEISSAKIPMAQPTFREASYALGLARVELPGPMGHIGMKPSLMPDGKMPTVVRGAQPKLAFYHQGSFPGAFSAIAMIPELLNVAVAILEEIMNALERNDYVTAARHSAAETLEWYRKTVSDLEKMRTANASAPLVAYVGTFWNRKRYAKIKISACVSAGVSSELLAKAAG
ncbi:hypothetical protein QBC46DRAFT_420483 [Diplogelasinospora grovesii]|uniref:Uncharacterized protein n=1 Tax=Diplogelasinospora grovesii TaxID=303347 RepID=A0AAN6N0B9_9PEZI|nr:hypothetical protein QBC46DRAFT_420483 [Diplogelasinospora grovesii]